MIPFDIDVVVVGAGAVGLATAYACARRGLAVVVLEKEETIGSGVSSRNSEVIHGGLYYPPGSLKARLCVEGRRLLYGFLETHGVPYDKCGKLVVATEASELEVLDRIVVSAAANGVEGIVHVSEAQAKGMEPELRTVGALHSPESGIFDSHAYMLALQGEIESNSGAVALLTPFVGATPIAGGGFEVRAGGEEPTTLRARYLILAPGLGAQAAAALVEGFPASQNPELHYGKGSYFVLSGKAPFGRLIYPPPIKGALGVHYKRDLGGRAHFGPDLEFVEVEDYTVDPRRAEGFYSYVRRFWPGQPDGALSPDYAGLRPKLHGPDEPQPDFVLETVADHGLEGLLAMFGIESPGLTSSMALGEEAVKRLGIG
jgi:L-2-hydroxyglutarate oxidase LhgO